MSYFKLSAEERKTVFVLFGLTLLYVLPVLIANTPYNDDFSRIIIGNSWDDDGRLLPSILVRILVHATTIYSPAPLPLLLSIPIFVWGGLLIRRLFVNIEDSCLSGLIAFGFVLNPFLLCLFVYQLDALGLALSLVLLIVPYTLALPSGGSKRLVGYYAKCSLCIFLSMNSYQASLGFFMSLAVIELVFNVYRDRLDDAVTYLIRRALQLIIGFVAYKLFLKLFFIANIARRASGSEMVPFSFEGLELFTANCWQFVLRIIDALSQQQIIILAVLMVLSIAFGIYLYKQKVSGSEVGLINKVLLLVVPLAPVFILFFSFIHIALLKDAAELPIQVLTSFSGLTAFLFLVPGWFFSKSTKAYWILTPVFISALGFSYIMGNLVKIEVDFHGPLLTSIVEKINDTNPHRDKTVYYSGDISHSKYYYRLEDTFPLIHSLNTSNAWSIKYKLPYYGCGVKNYRDISNDPQFAELDLNSLPVIADSFYYRLYRLNSDFLLKFK